MARFNDILQQRISRRGFLGAFVASTILMNVPKALRAEENETLAKPEPLFKELPHDHQQGARVAEGYTITRLISWGDAVLADAPAFDFGNVENPDAQKKQFGYNNDFTAFFPINGNPQHGLLTVNHEYPIAELMFGLDNPRKISATQANTMLASLGMSVVEIASEKGVWKPLAPGQYNRRITALETKINLSGAAAGSDRLKTREDTTGSEVVGTLGNCSGGVTPWGTMLSGEENIDGFFSGKAKGREEANHAAMGIKNKGGKYTFFAEHNARFSVEETPNEPNRFGWVVETDPFNPKATPVKRTALGRFKHEGATVTLSDDGRVVVYSGDDEAFEHLYKFVSKKKYDPKNPEANSKLLDDGVLYVARFTEEEVHWLPLVYGYSVLTEKNGFTSQADVLIETRRAAKLLGATEMDRPEDIEVHPVFGSVFVVLTMNQDRQTSNAVNKRFPNPHGHIVELLPPKKTTGYNHAAQRFKWKPFLLAGNPYEPVDMSYYQTKPSEDGWLSCPDNLAIDPKGRLWVATDGQDATIPADDSLYMVETTGANIGAPRHFFNAPIGAEVTGPSFTPDGKTLFLSVQHPASGSQAGTPSTRWPDNTPTSIPRPSVVVITKNNGGIIGG